MLSLQDLGAELVALNDAQLESIDLPENLRDAVSAAKRMTRFEARRRQLQYIGKLMRAVDPEPIRAHLDMWKATSRAHTARLHRIERWREHMLDDEAGLTEFIAAHPYADAQQLRTLVRNAKRERAESKPPRHYRALFHLIHGAIEQKEAAGYDDDDQ